jgi:hypothetical protein
MYSTIIILDNNQSIDICIGFRCSGQGPLRDLNSQWPLKFHKGGEYLEELNEYQFKFGI